MNAANGYEKILPQPPSGHEPQQHSKKISLLFTACLVILLTAAGFAAAGFLHGMNTHQDESVVNVIRSSALIQAVCKKTLYFEVCNSSLRAYPGALKANASELAKIAVEVSRDEAKDVVELALDLNRTAGKDCPGSLAPLADCLEVLGDSIEELNSSLSAMGDRNWRRRSGDVKAWLSAALTNPFSCIDGFEEVDVSMPLIMQQRVEYLTELTSNALAIVNYVAGVGDKIVKAHKTPGMNRRLLFRGH